MYIIYALRLEKTHIYVKRQLKTIWKNVYSPLKIVVQRLILNL